MATFIALIDYTDQGIGKIKDTTKRSAEFKASVEGLGARVKDIYWTMGAHDGVLVFEAPDDETASAVLLSLAQRGMVRSQVLRAFERPEMETILSKMGS